MPILSSAGRVEAWLWLPGWSERNELSVQLLVAEDHTLLRPAVSPPMALAVDDAYERLELGEDPSELLAMDDLLMKIPSSSETVQEEITVLLQARFALVTRCRPRHRRTLWCARRDSCNNEPAFREG